MSRGYGQQGGDCVNCGVSTAALRSEVEVLKRRLLDRDVAIVQLEAQMAQDRPDHYPQGQVAVLRAQCDHWQDKYDRLLEAHKRLQKVNQGLEDKLLRLVDRTESEKSSLAADTASLTTALTTAAQAINRLKQENDRYKNDLNLAIQLLQCNPSRYAAHKLDSLPLDVQKKAKSRLAREPRDNPKPEMKVIKVPIPTFPPTAMVYSVNKYAEQNEKEEPVDAVSAAIMAAVLEERQRERARRHCSTCACGSPKSETRENTVVDILQADENEELNGNHLFDQDDGLNRNSNSRFKVNVVDVGTQVLPSYIGETGKVQSTCIYCHSSKNTSSEKLSSLEHVSSKAMNLSQHTRSKSQPVNQLTAQADEDPPVRHIDPSSPDILLKSPTARTFTFASHSGGAWDWAAEGHDSGTPSTPSSLISASLSYESETSNATSPQDSPGRLPLIPTRSMVIKSSTQNSTDAPARVLDSVEGNVHTSQSSRLMGETTVSASVISPYHNVSHSITSNLSRQSSSTYSSSHVPVVMSSTFPHQSHVPRQHISYPSVSTNVSRTIDRTNSNFTPSSPAVYKIPFNARSPYQDVFTPPIHRSPPNPSKERESRGRKGSTTDVIASSTTTASNTETTL
ncbi:uncharacterized protein [Panulirus ornatus]|uniref:uncharacterized protein isoform X2 n=1 Tax=Panulirus ornatus TaxID=150431 RepID=UPI003A8A0E35